MLWSMCGRSWSGPDSRRLACCCASTHLPHSVPTHSTHAQARLERKQPLKQLCARAYNDGKTSFGTGAASAVAAASASASASAAGNDTALAAVSVLAGGSGAGAGLPMSDEDKMMVDQQIYMY